MYYLQRQLWIFLYQDRSLYVEKLDKLEFYDFPPLLIFHNLTLSPLISIFMKKFNCKEPIGRSLNMSHKLTFFSLQIKPFFTNLVIYAMRTEDGLKNFDRLVAFFNLPISLQITGKLNKLLKLHMLAYCFCFTLITSMYWSMCLSYVFFVIIKQKTHSKLKYKMTNIFKYKSFENNITIDFFKKSFMQLMLYTMIVFFSHYIKIF